MSYESVKDDMFFPIFEISIYFGYIPAVHRGYDFLQCFFFIF